MAKQPKKVAADYHALAKKCGMSWVGQALPSDSTENADMAMSEISVLSSMKTGHSDLTQVSIKRRQDHWVNSSLSAERLLSGVKRTCSMHGLICVVPTRIRLK